MALAVAVALPGVGVGAVTRRRPFTPPGFVGQRLVGTPAELAAELGVEAAEVARAVVVARLEAWGCNARGAGVAGP